MTGKFIVLEGGDGVGKKTQAELLVQWLRGQGKQVELITYPNYENPFGQATKAMLHGAYGDPVGLNPYFASAFYTIDRAQDKKRLQSLLAEGVWIVADRYTTASLGYQAAKLPESEQRAFAEWLLHLEQVELGLPVPDVILFLTMPAELSKELASKRGLQDRHETNCEYQTLAREAFARMAEWFAWDCIATAENEVVRAREAIHADIQKAVSVLL